MTAKVKKTVHPPNSREWQRQTREEEKCQLCEKKVPLVEQYTLDNDLEKDIVKVRKNAARKGAETKSHYCVECKEIRRKKKTAWLHERAERLGKGSSTSTESPVEKGPREGYEIASSIEVREAERREWRLVCDYKAYLEAQGDQLCAMKLRLPGTSDALRIDLFNKTREQLIEAKTKATRNNVRMAIGQIADYRRLIEPPPKECAVLLEEKPCSDLLALLNSQGISAVWRTEKGFADTIPR